MEKNIESPPPVEVMAVQYPNHDAHEEEEEEEEDTACVLLLNTLTCQRYDLADAVINLEDLKRNIPLDNSRVSTVSDTHISASLGKLDTLPLELVHEVILALDLQSLTNFRAVSSTARALVNSNPAYRNVAAHAPDAVRAYIATSLASSFNIAQLLETLCSQFCALCNDFGGFLFLPNCIRCCWACLTQHPDLLPVSAGHARVIFGLTKAGAAKVPVMQSIPGLYKMRLKTCNMIRAEPLVSKITARRIGSAIHGSREKMEVHVAKIRAKQDAAYEKEIAIYHQEVAERFEKWERERPSFKEVNAAPIIKKPVVPPFSGDVDQKDDDIRRLLGVIPFPTLDRRTGRAQVGVSCKGCTNTLPIELIPNEFYPAGIGSGHAQYDGRKRELARMFTDEGYLEHYAECGRAQSLWEFKSKGLASPL